MKSAGSTIVPHQLTSYPQQPEISEEEAKETESDARARVLANFSSELMAQSKGDSSLDAMVQRYKR